MSLHSKLGPQGRALIQGNGGYGGSGGVFEGMDSAPQELDYLVHDLRNPLENMTVNKVLGYMYHYLPFVKVEHNLRIVFASFLNNPTCFKAGGAPFEENYTIIEAFKAITDKKLSISQPTLPIKTWYKILLQELTNFALVDVVANSWKVLPIISGIILSNSLRDELYSRINVIEYKWYFNEWDNKAHDLFVRSLGNSLSGYNSDDIVNLSLLSFAVTYKKSDQKISSYTPGISSGFVINRLIQMIFSNGPHTTQVYEKFFQMNPNMDPEEMSKLINIEIMNKPIIKHLNRLSFLLEAYFRILPKEESSFELIMDNLTKIKLFNDSLATATQMSLFNHNNSSTDQSALFQQFWYLMKNIFFSQCIIVQGIFTRFLISNKSTRFSAFIVNPFQNTGLLEREYRLIALKVVEIFYHMNHILLSIGQGGFDSYNFVYYLSLELIFGSKFLTIELEKLSMYLIGNPKVNLYFENINSDLINRSKVLFVMGLWENYLQNQKANNDFVKSNIFPICFDIANNPRVDNYDVIEACHSSLLLCFSNRRANKHLKESMNYVDLIINQFPRTLSANQLSIAIETLGKQILSDPISYQGDQAFSNSAEEFLEFINFKCFNTRSGIPIVSKDEKDTLTSAQPITEIQAESTMRVLNSKEGKVDIIDENKMKKPKNSIKLDFLPEDTPNKQNYQFQKRYTPETSREAMILAFINLIPYFPLSIFIRWLEKIFCLIDASNQSEQTYLVGIFWKVISENLDLNRCEFAYRWWYEYKNAVDGELGLVNSKM